MASPEILETKNPDSSLKKPESLSLTSLKNFVDKLNPNMPLIGPIISMAQKFLN